jgi:hypothetical protein
MPPKKTPRSLLIARRVDNSGGPAACWPWTGSCTRHGYGKLSATEVAHRVAWELTNGPIPSGLCVLHRCDNPPCCNPAHLFLGTRSDNVADMVAKGRAAVGDKAGARKHPDCVPRGNQHWTRRRPELMERGERHHKAKLTDQQVAEVKRRAGSGARQCDLAREYEASPACICNIISGKTRA